MVVTVLQFLSICLTQPISLPIETLISSHNSNLPISENTENDTQLTQLDHPDSIDGKFAYHLSHVYILSLGIFVTFSFWSLIRL